VAGTAAIIHMLSGDFATGTESILIIPLGKVVCHGHNTTYLIL